MSAPYILLAKLAGVWILAASVQVVFLLPRLTRALERIADAVEKVSDA